MVSWIVYGDGFEHTDEHGPPTAVPPFGVLGIAVWSEAVGYELLAEKTYFAWSESRGWDQHDMTGLVDRLAHDPGCIVRFGRSVPTDRFRRELRARAAADMRLPRKSGTERSELPAGEVSD